MFPRRWNRQVRRRKAAEIGGSRISSAAGAVEVECTHCGIPMTAYLGVQSRIRYFRCQSCGRWISSTYTEIFRIDANVRIQPTKSAEAPGSQFGEVKQRLEQWLATLDSQDPY